MNLFFAKLVRSRRRRRVPCGLLVSVASALLIALTLTASAALFTLSASAKIDVGMPRTGDGTVTDSDGIIDSDGPMGDVPEMTDMLPDGTDGRTEGSDALDPTVSGTDGASDTAAVTTQRAPGTTDMVEGAADNLGISPWLLGVILLAIVVAVIILIIRWASGPRRR